MPETDAPPSTGAKCRRAVAGIGALHARSPRDRLALRRKRAAPGRVPVALHGGRQQLPRHGARHGGDHPDAEDLATANLVAVREVEQLVARAEDLVGAREHLGAEGREREAAPAALE